MINVQLQEFPSIRNIRKNTPWHIVIKLLKTSGEEKDIMQRGIKMTDFSSEMIQVESR